MEIESVGSWMGQGDSGQGSKPVGLINHFFVDNSCNCFLLGQ